MVVPRTLPTMQRSTKTLMTPDEWDIAACRYHPKELWFPEAANHKVNYLKAKHICNTCPVQQPCLKAGQSEVFGMWGGLTPAERGYGRSTTAAPMSTERIASLLEHHNQPTHKETCLHDQPPCCTTRTLPPMRQSCHTRSGPRHS